MEKGTVIADYIAEDRTGTATMGDGQSRQLIKPIIYVGIHSSGLLQFSMCAHSSPALSILQFAIELTCATCNLVAHSQNYVFRVRWKVYAVLHRIYPSDGATRFGFNSRTFVQPINT